MNLYKQEKDELEEGEKREEVSMGSDKLNK
jgi:hypothetical protein